MYSTLCPLLNKASLTSHPQDVLVVQLFEHGPFHLVGLQRLPVEQRHAVLGLDGLLVAVDWSTENNTDTASA